MHRRPPSSRSFTFLATLGLAPLTYACDVGPDDPEAPSARGLQLAGADAAARHGGDDRPAGKAGGGPGGKSGNGQGGAGGVGSCGASGSGGSGGTGEAGSGGSGAQGGTGGSAGGASGAGGSGGAPPDVVAQLAAGGYFGCARFESGKAQCWGSNQYGQLGHGPLGGVEPAPGAVVDGSGQALGGVRSLGLGESHACAVFDDLSVRCWGRNQSGQLGNGSFNEGTPVPAPVVDAGGAALQGATRVGSGAAFSCAALADTTVRCWGDNAQGQLGIGWGSSMQATATAPVADFEGTPLQGVTGLALGREHACALLGDKTLRCWGSNAFGELGNGAAGLSASPDAVPALDAEGNVLQGVRQVALGYGRTCALLESGGVSCWGNYDPNPAPVFDEFGDALQNVEEVALGSAHGCVRLADATLRCWGDPTYGQLGNVNNPGWWGAYPVLDEGGAELQGARELALGWQHSCVRRDDGSSLCWGDNGYAQGGRPLDEVASMTPSRPVDAGGQPLAGVRQIGAGPFHACSVHDDDTLRCWGLDDSGQSGNDALAMISPRASVVRDAQDQTFHARGVAAAGNHSCAFDPQGQTYCWGANYYYQLGTPSLSPPETLRPGLVPGAGSLQLALATLYSCSRDPFNHAVCWGYGGEALSAVTDDFGSPIWGVTQISAAPGGGCAIAFGGEVWCWDFATWGAASAVARPVHREDNIRVMNVRALVSAASETPRTCAVRQDGTVRCWSNNQDVAALLRDGAGNVVTGVSDLAIGRDHTCAVFADGKLRCWGDNSLGQCGVGPGPSTVVAPTPVRDASGAEIANVRQVVAGESYTCAVLQDGTPLCWGSNATGQMGNGLYPGMPHHVPAPIVGLGDEPGGGTGGSGGSGTGGSGGSGTGGSGTGGSGTGGSGGSGTGGTGGTGGSGTGGSGGTGGTGGSGGSGGTGGSGGACNGVENTPFGTYALTLHNVVKRCSTYYLDCWEPTVEDGPATLTVTDAGGLFAQLSAPTLSLDGESSHNDGEWPLIYYPSDGTVGLWDPARRETETWIRLRLDAVCQDGFSNSSGKAEYDIELATGTVLRAHRECLNLKNATVFYDVRADGAGALVCQP